MLHKKKIKKIITQQHEIGIVIVSSLCIFVLAALCSYHPYDASFIYYTHPANPIGNWCGRFGASFSALLVYFFGAAILFLIPGIIFVWYLYVKKHLHYSLHRLFALCMYVIMSAGLCTAYQFNTSYSALAGGICGDFLCKGLFFLFGDIGTFIMLHTMWMMAIILLTQFSFMPAVHCIMQIISNGVNTLLSVRFCLYGMLFVQKCMHGCFFTMRHLMVRIHSLLHRVWHALHNAKYNANNQHETFFYASASSTHVSSSGTVADAVAQQSKKVVMHNGGYVLPTLPTQAIMYDDPAHKGMHQELDQRALLLELKLQQFGIHGKVIAIKSGPVVTLFEYKPNNDIKLSKIITLENDLAMALQALSIRILAPIPGKAVVGFEVANHKRKDVFFAKLMYTDEYKNNDAALPLILGEDTIGSPMICDLARMPHLLIAGSTGSGKSVALNALLISLLGKLTPDELKLILIDPKRLEFGAYADIAHLLFPVVTDPVRAVPVLRWVVQHMEERYEQIACVGVRTIHEYNRVMKQKEQPLLPFIVVMIDELSDLMMAAGNDIEQLIIRIAQKARAAGIHLIVATQRPSADIITGLIKVNFPSRIAFRVTSKVDSRTILDSNGADTLLGRGDMLFLDSTAISLKRIHGAYVSDIEIQTIIEAIRAQKNVVYVDLAPSMFAHKTTLSHEDELLYEQVRLFVKEVDEVSISLLQRTFNIGYNRSARIIAQLEAHGLIMPLDGSRMRKVIR